MKPFLPLYLYSAWCTGDPISIGICKSHRNITLKKGTIGIQPSRSTASDVKDKKGDLGSHVIQRFGLNDQNTPLCFEVYGFTSALFLHK